MSWLERGSGGGTWEKCGRLGGRWYTSTCCRSTLQAEALPPTWYCCRYLVHSTAVDLATMQPGDTHAASADPPLLSSFLSACRHTTHPPARTVTGGGSHMPPPPSLSLTQTYYKSPRPARTAAGCQHDPPLPSPTCRLTTNPPAQPALLRDANMTPPLPSPTCRRTTNPPARTAAGILPRRSAATPVASADPRTYIAGARAPHSAGNPYGWQLSPETTKATTSAAAAVEVWNAGGGCISRPTQEHLLQDHVPSPRLTAHPVECNVCWRTTMPRCRLF